MRMGVCICIFCQCPCGCPWVSIFSLNTTPARSRQCSDDVMFSSVFSWSSVIFPARTASVLCTVVIPDRYPRPYWRSIVNAECVHSVSCSQRRSGCSRAPGKPSFEEYEPILFDLWTFQVSYSAFMTTLWVCVELNLVSSISIYHRKQQQSSVVFYCSPYVWSHTYGFQQ